MQDEFTELLAAYVLGALEPDEMARVAAHLDGCVTCAAEASDLRRAASRLDRSAPPPEVWARIEEELRETGEPENPAEHD